MIIIKIHDINKVTWILIKYMNKILILISNNNKFINIDKNNLILI